MRRRLAPGRPSERGAALLAVLAMLVLLSALATFGIDRLRAATARVNGSDGRGRAMAVVAAALEAAMPLIGPLKAAAGGRPERLGRAIPLDLAGGHAVLRFADASACFNLNSLAPGAGGLPPQAKPEQFARMLAAAGIAGTDADRLADATAARLADRRLLWAEPGEWLDVAGVTAADWRRVRPLLCALPNREATALNANLLTLEQAPLLVAAGLQPDEARRAILARPAGGWNSNSDFWQKASPAGIPETAGAQAVGVDSRWLSVRIRAEVPGARVERLYLLDTARRPARVAAARWLAA